jgi:hypothetical protein
MLCVTFMIAPGTMQTYWRRQLVVDDTQQSRSVAESQSSLRIELAITLDWKESYQRL